jgi:hypothetical protein
MNISQVEVEMRQILENECKPAFIYQQLQYLVTTPYLRVLVIYIYRRENISSV